MANFNEIKFYTTLESIFTGAKIEGDSGYVNLLKIKEIYYHKILDIFKKEVQKNQIINSFKEEFFDKMYSFFEKYFSESGSVYFVKTANWQRVYEQVYTDNRDVVLFWKTHMLYYVKSDTLFKSIEVEITDDKELKHNFFFDVSEMKAKQNNEKKSLVFNFTETTENPEKLDRYNKPVEVHNFAVAYSERGNKTKTEDIAKKLKITETLLVQAFTAFRKQSEVDFFINKDANKFLTEQLDMYLHQILLNEENKFEQKRLDEIKTLKEFALKIIKFIAQFEDELVRVWNKPKFAMQSNYVITLDKINKDIIEKLKTHPNLNQQIAEWHELGMVEKNFDIETVFKDGMYNQTNPKYQYLPFDTKYFKDLEIEILQQFDNLDEQLDGRLIHSENYQALNTLQTKYKEKVQCIYIDPPFNTGHDFDYVDRFQDCSWLTLMDNRLQLSKKFLQNVGGFYLHLDQNADFWGRELMNKNFGNENFVNQIIWCYREGSNSKKYFNNKHDIIVLYSKEQEKNLFNYQDILEDYAEGNIKKYKYKDEKGNYRIMGRGIQSSPFCSKRDLSPEIEKQYPDLVYRHYLGDGKIPMDYWIIDVINQASNERADFLTQKPELLIERIIKVSTNELGYVLDYHAGSGTTIAVAHKLGRKWLGVEMGNHFHTVDIPRLKKVLSGYVEGISKNIKEFKGGGFFKYYKLEQYEDTLRNMKYSSDKNLDIYNQRRAFEQYIFFADNKLADVLETEKDTIELNFEKLYKDIDFAETISNLIGLPIKRITKTTVVLQDGDSEKTINTDIANMTKLEKLEFVRMLKPLLWWGKE